MSFQQHQAAVDPQIAYLTFSVGAIKVDMEEDALIIAHIESKALAPLATTDRQGFAGRMK